MYQFYSMPETWPGWLRKAFQAEKICADKGMSKEMCHHLLAFETPEKIIKFIDEFTFEQRSYQIQYSLSGSGDEGSRWVK